MIQNNELQVLPILLLSHEHIAWVGIGVNEALLIDHIDESF